MQAMVTCHVLPPTLVSGATGRADARSEERGRVLASLAQSLVDAGLGPASTGAGPGPSRRAGAEVVPVLLIAPGRSSLLAVDARPDLGALGISEPRPGSEGPAVRTTVRGRPARAGYLSGSPGPVLGVTASVAMTLLRAAGWDGPVQTLETVGEPELDSTVEELLVGRALVVVALASADVRLPPGAPRSLATGQARVWELAQRLDRSAPHL